MNNNDAMQYLLTNNSPDVSTNNKNNNDTALSSYVSDIPSGPYDDKWLLNELNNSKLIKNISSSFRNGINWHFIDCPWESEHTGEKNPTDCAVYIYNGYPVFKCQHSHCSNRKFEDFAKKTKILLKKNKNKSESDSFLVKDNQLFLVSGEKIIHVSDGELIVSHLYEYYDGNETTKHFEIGGTSWNGKELKPITINASRLSNIRTLILEQFGDSIVLDPRQTASAQAIAHMMQTAHTAPREFILSSTGFFNINGKLVFSHGGGAIGDNTIKTRLENNVSMYAMNDIPAGNTARDAFRAIIQLLEVHDINVTGPGLSYALLPILMHILKKECQAQPFTLYMVGEKASGKTVFAKLMTSLYASKMIDSAGAPASFDASPTAIEITAHCLKDSLLLMDDNHPCNTKREADRHAELLRYIVRSSTNGIGRMRGTSDIKIRQGNPPRCLTVMTGEDRPNIEQSCVDRMFYVDVPTVNLTAYKQAYKTAVNNARSGLLTGAMYQYIAYIIENYDAYKTKVIELYECIKSEVDKNIEMTRLSEHVALLMTAISAYLFYANEQNLITKNKMDEIGDRIFKSINNAALNSELEIKAADPVEIYISALKTIIKTQHRVVDLDKTPEYLQEHRFRHPLGDKDIGWFNSQYYYLEPDLTQVAVYELLQKQGEYFSASKSKVNKGLKQRGLIVPGYDGTPTKNITIDGISKKRLVIPRSVIDDDEELTDTLSD